ncbi:hypothetical protein [Litorilituus lipolyticus]|uniref:Lipoprotein n=1 Tax=Litorilituus lipolyticus TaxID=2491017 RepID=A0A502KW76_9GAMM|nr:hypothetical protein [Litorilituus lipolyticus]TPH15882.1 hypothetical protein EPA86_07900 [Litorilituus lipolyticus]
MLKRIFITFSFFALCACQPVNLSKQQDTAIDYQCISSQSQCIVDSELLQVKVEFAQQKNHNNNDKVANSTVDNIMAEMPFKVLLTLSGENLVNVAHVSAYLEGRDMFMGQVPLSFSVTEFTNVVSEKNHIAKENIENVLQYQAESLLANCTEETMVWRMWLIVEYKDDGNGQQKQKMFIDFTGQRR